MPNHPGLIELLNGGNAAFRKLNAHLLTPAAPVAKIKLTNAYANHHTPLASGVSPEKPKSRSRKTLHGSTAPVQQGSAGCTCVVITRCSSRLLDRDNLWSSAKALVDALRYSGRITGDREEDIELFVFQAKVPRKEIGTLVEIIPL